MQLQAASGGALEEILKKNSLVILRGARLTQRGGGGRGGANVLEYLLSFSM